MATDYTKMGQRIGYLRKKKGLSQEELAEEVNLSRESISMIESGKTGARAETLIEIANSLGVSTDDILVDYLDYPVSTVSSELHQLLMDCTKEEEYILTQTVKALKAILSSRGI